MLKWIAATGFAATLISVAFAAEVDPGAYEPYTRDQYPKTFEKWGTAGVRKIDKVRAAAAKKAAASRECDKVEYAELSDARSTPKKRIVVFVDCTNGKRFYISDSEVAIPGDAPVQSEETKMRALPDRVAIERCETALKASLKFPSSYNAVWGGKGVYRAPTTGKVVATIDFTAKNGFGNEIPQRAQCFFSSAGMTGPELSDR
ncbi:MAG: hypothetical protein WA943_12060 [Parvibaculum sp.]|uniref:hypothetical protein n=1 Tax=Parvibaculum sp. TaxID=2024848 RepID=UPI003C73208B